jgi:hypothetical protein
MKRVVLAGALLLWGAPSLLVAATVRGKALDAGGKPAAAVQLVLLNLETVRMTMVETDERGDFSLALGPGQYAVYSQRSGAARLLTELVLREDELRLIDLRLDSRGEVSIEAREGAAAQLPAPEGAPGPDAGLTSIRDYRVQVLGSGTSPAGSRGLAEVVNPFAAKKGGRFHGSVYQFHRNDNFDARNFFDSVGVELPEYKRNQFGATFGAVPTPKVNLFGTYEGLRIVQGSTLLSHVPTAAMRRGDFSELAAELRDPASGLTLPGNRIPDSRVHPVARGLLGLLPDPNRADPDRNFVNNQPVVVNRDTVSGRIDHPFSPGSHLFARYLVSNGESRHVHPLPAFGSVRIERDQELQLSFSRKITNRLLSTSRVEFARKRDVLTSVNAGKAGLLASLGISGVGVLDDSEEGYPDFRLSGYASLGDAQLPSTSTYNRLSFDSSLSYSPANHSLRLGIGITAYQINDQRSDGVRRGRFTFNGYYSGDAFADFLFGVPDTATRGIGSDRADLRRKTWLLFVRDQWKLGPRFTLNLGLTYDYHAPYRSRHDNVSGFHPLVLDPPADGELIVAGSSRAHELGFDAAGRGGLVFPDRNDFAPSVSLAFRPSGSNRVVLRTGFRVYHTPLSAGYYVSYLGRNSPFYYTQTAQSPIDRALLDMARPFETAVAAELGIRGIDSRLRTGYVESWDFNVAGEILEHWSIAASYEGARGIGQSRVVYGNVPLPGAGALQGRRSNPSFGRFTIVTAGGSYTRHALELGAERRLADGLSIKTAFHWNRILNDLYRGFPSNPRDLRSERGPADFVPARSFSLNYLYDLPVGRNGRFLHGAHGWLEAFVGGWRLSGITHIQQGYPYDINVPGDPNNDGLSEDRADRLASGRLDPGVRSIDRWFDTAAFAAPAPYSFGNSGRNILVGPPYHNWDVSLIKQTRFSDGHMVEFRVELFNAFNHVNFELPQAALATSTFGKVFGARRAREIELALRYTF